MAQQAIGMIETKGLCALFEATDAALKAANVSFTGWEKIGSGYVTAFFRGDVVGGFPSGHRRQRAGHPPSARRPVGARQVAAVNRSGVMEYWSNGAMTSTPKTPALQNSITP